MMTQLPFFSLDIWDNFGFLKNHENTSSLTMVEMRKT
jgi:hypothetical protein